MNAYLLQYYPDVQFLNIKQQIITLQIQYHDFFKYVWHHISQNNKKK